MLVRANLVSVAYRTPNGALVVCGPIDDVGLGTPAAHTCLLIWMDACHCRGGGVGGVVQHRRGEELLSEGNGEVPLLHEPFKI